MTPADWALIAVIYMAVGAVWDLVRPDDYVADYNNPWRVVLGVVGAVAVFVTCFLVLGVATPWIVAAGTGFLLLGAIKALAER